MVEQQLFNPNYELILKIRDLEENQRLMKERLLLISENFIEAQEKNSGEITEIKKQIVEINSDVERIKQKIDSIGEEVSKSARKQELAILARQFKMFEPLNMARIEDVEKIVDEKINKLSLHAKEEKKEEAAHKFWTGKI